MQAGVLVAQIVCVGTSAELVVVLDVLPAVDAHGAVGALGPLNADPHGTRVDFELQAAIGAGKFRPARSADGSSLGLVWHGVSFL